MRLMSRVFWSLSVSALVASPVLAVERCVWADGGDPTAPPNDGGRGVGDWSAHQGYVLNGPGVATASGLVAARLATLKGCLTTDEFARLYADLSLLIGAYGRASAGWQNAMDPKAPADDPGRGIAAWQAHADYVLRGPGLGNAHKLVGDRLHTLSTALPKPLYARVYADVSILAANYARISAGR